MDRVLATLNPAQREAVSSSAQVLQVLAPPGSGKTKTLTARVAHLIETGLQPWHIIVCTFTVKAAREMQSRIQELVEDSGKVKIGTFHGIALRYLRKHRQLIGLSKAFGVADTSDSTAILRRLIKLHQSTIDAGVARSRISSLKAKGIDCETYAQGEGKSAKHNHFLNLYHAYEAELRRAGLLDYDDILLRCVDLLRAHPECVNDIQAVLVDEFQDTNNVQYELMSLFAQKKQNITIVGDPDQSIYGWRSAEIKNLHRMRQRWDKTVTINLAENYRSTGSILSAAQAVIEQDRTRPQKALQATLSYGHKPILRRLPTARDEATWLVDEIKRIQGLCGGLLTHNDFAILLRTASLSRSIETSLGSAGIAYRMVGGTKFFDRVEVKLVLDYLRVVDNPAHNEALARVLNVPPRRIGEKALEGLQADALQKGVSAWSLVHGLACGRATTTASITQPGMKGIEQFANIILTCRKRLQDNDVTIVDIINIILQKTGYQSYLRGKYAEEWETRWASIEDLIAQASDQPQTQGVDSSQSEIGFNSTTTLSEFLANAALAAAVDTGTDEQAKPMVTISTMHAAKGLEWPIVFVPACYNGSLPHSRSENHDEERRLLYVAMTRAQAMLYLSCPATDSQKQETVQSLFLSPPECTKLFDERGSPLTYNDVQSLALVLRRVCPDSTAIRQSSAELLCDADDFWPVDGSAPPHEYRRPYVTHHNSTSNASSNSKDTHNHVGFASVRSQFDSLQKLETEATKEAISRQLSMKTKDKSAKAHGADIAAFFQSKTISVLPSTTMQQGSTIKALSSGSPLNNITNQSQQHMTSLDSMQQLQQSHTLRKEPLHKRQRTAGPEATNVKVHNPYAMLSSSPQASDNEKENAALPVSTAILPEYKAASTTHVTSCRSLTNVRRTLGVRRSLNGWAQRGQTRKVSDGGSSIGKSS